MALNVRKEDFLRNVREICSALSRDVHLIQRLAEMHADEFSSGKSNEITLEDINQSNFGITPAKLAKLTDVSAQLQNWWNNVAVTAQDNKKFVQNLMNGL